jgi:hypothetical protein
MFESLAAWFKKSLKIPKMEEGYILQWPKEKKIYNCQQNTRQEFLLH